MQNLSTNYFLFQTSTPAFAWDSLSSPMTLGRGVASAQSPLHRNFLLRRGWWPRVCNLQSHPPLPMSWQAHLFLGMRAQLFAQKSRLKKNRLPFVLCVELELRNHLSLFFTFFFFYCFNFSSSFASLSFCSSSSFLSRSRSCVRVTSNFSYSSTSCPKRAHVLHDYLFWFIVWTMFLNSRFTIFNLPFHN